MRRFEMTSRLIVISLIYSVFFSFLAVSKAHAAYLFFEPETKNVAVGETFTVTLRIDTETEKVQAAEAWIIYNAEELELVDVKDPEAGEKFFGSNVVHKSTGTLLYIANWIVLGTDAISTEPGKDGLAVMNFKAQKAGTYNLDIKCVVGDNRDSTIAARKNKKSVDVIDCAKVKDGVYTIGGAGGQSTPVPTRTATISQPRTTTTPLPTQGRSLTPTTAHTTLTPVLTATLTPTPALTSTPTPTVGGTGGTAITTAPTATASALPATGQFETTATVIGVGIILTIVSIAIKIFIL